MIVMSNVWQIDFSPPLIAVNLFLISLSKFVIDHSECRKMGDSDGGGSGGGGEMSIKIRTFVNWYTEKIIVNVTIFHKNAINAM